MTAVRNLGSAASNQRAEQPIRPRLIGVGVHDILHDRGTIEWAVDDAVPGRDSVHIVHAYIPLRLDGCAWSPVTTLRDRRHTVATRIVSQAVQRAIEGALEEHAGLEVGGSAIAGLPEDVLIELSSVVDLLVIGDDSHDTLVTRKITSRVQDRVQCPIVCVPRNFRAQGDDRPVTVVVDEFGLCDDVMDFAAAEATRRDVTLQVSRAWSALHEGKVDGPGWLAEQQEELDEQLATWRTYHPQLAIAARLELGYSWLDRVRAISSLLVTASRSADLLRSPGETDHTCPVAIIP
jgi:hypothetical protein